MLKSLHSLGSCAENFMLIQISSILSVIFTRLWLKCQSVLMGQLQLSKACWELWLSNDQPHSDYNGQWQRALCILAVLQSSQPNPQRNEKKRKMYAIKQIKICAALVCRVPGHATEASVYFVRYTWASAYRPQPRFLTNQPWPGKHVPVFYTDLNLYNISYQLGLDLILKWFVHNKDSFPVFQQILTISTRFMFFCVA